MGRSSRHSKKGFSFWTFYILLIVLIAALLTALYVYVRGILIDYERNTPENYVLWLVEDVSEKSDLGKFLEEKNFSDNRYGDGSARKTCFYSRVKDAQLEVKKSKFNTSFEPTYDILANGQPLITIRLSEEGTATKLGIMTMSYWNIDSAIVRDEYSKAEVGKENTLSYRIVIPEGFSIALDGEVCNLSPKEETVLDDFKYVSQYVDVPKGLVYELTDLYYEPSISIMNNGGEEMIVEHQSSGIYTCKADYAESTQAKDFMESILDPMEIAKTWSLFMTDDVGGARHGLQTVIDNCRLRYGTELYNLALRWASNVDITFVSGHVLKPWTGEHVGNFVQYNDNLMSCDVYVEKNMTISRGLGDRQDVFNNRMYFGYIKGMWYLLDMVTLEK